MAHADDSLDRNTILRPPAHDAFLPWQWLGQPEQHAERNNKPSHQQFAISGYEIMVFCKGDILFLTSDSNCMFQSGRMLPHYWSLFWKHVAADHVENWVDMQNDRKAEDDEIRVTST